MSALINELEDAITKAEAEVATLQAGDPSEHLMDAGKLSYLLKTFVGPASERLAELRAGYHSCLGALEGVALYFGEAFSPQEPTRIFVLLKDFMAIFAKAAGAAKAALTASSEGAKPAAAVGRGGRRKATAPGQPIAMSGASDPALQPSQHKEASDTHSNLLKHT